MLVGISNDVVLVVLGYLGRVGFILSKLRFEFQIYLVTFHFPLPYFIGS